MLKAKDSLVVDRGEGGGAGSGEEGAGWNWIGCSRLGVDKGSMLQADTGSQAGSV